MPGIPAYWNRERLNQLRDILASLSIPIEGSTKRSIELKSNLPYAVWEKYVKIQPNASLGSVLAAVALLVDIGVVDKVSKRPGRGRSVRMFNPDIVLTDANIKEARAARKAKP